MKLRLKEKLLKKKFVKNLKKIRNYFMEKIYAI